MGMGDEGAELNGEYGLRGGRDGWCMVKKSTEYDEILTQVRKEQSRRGG